MSLPSLPTELLLNVTTRLPSEADRQSLRLSARQLYEKLPPPDVDPIRISIRGTDEYKSKSFSIAVWPRNGEQLDFLSRLARDVDGQTKVACMRCVRLVDFSVIKEVDRCDVCQCGEGKVTWWKCLLCGGKGWWREDGCREEG